MGGWMDYQRMRTRNNLMFRKPDDDPDPYWRSDAPYPSYVSAALVGDLNRMERDYLNPVYPEPPWALREPGSDPSSEVSTLTGIDVEVVRTVLRAVFFGASA